MKATDFTRIRDKRKEVEELKKMNEKEEEEIRLLEQEIQSDTVTGSRRDLTIGTIKITGVPSGKIQKKKERVRSRKRRIEDTINEIEETEEYINRISDPRLRRIARYRCEDLSWEEIANRIGGKATGEKCRKAIERMLKKAGQI